MIFHDFILAAEARLRSQGWARAGHNGAWPMLRYKDEKLACPLPAAILRDLEANCTFQPPVELYLLEYGWLRVKHISCQGSPIFFQGKFRRLPAALLEQLKYHRLDRYIQPNELRAVHSAGAPDTQR
jgi:hypothetical protein